MDFFTGNQDTDRLILLNLSGVDVIRACRVGKYAFGLCNKDFWFQKILIDFGINLSKYGNNQPYDDIYINIVKYIHKYFLDFNIKNILIASSYIGYFNLLKEIIKNIQI